jgi:hypothetical protein
MWLSKSKSRSERGWSLVGVLVVLLAVGGCGERTAVTLGDGGSAGDGVHQLSTYCQTAGNAVRFGGSDYSVAQHRVDATLDGPHPQLRISLVYSAAVDRPAELLVELEAPVGELKLPLDVDPERLPPNWRLKVISSIVGGSSSLIINGGPPPAPWSNLPARPKGRISLDANYKVLGLCLEGAKLVKYTYDVHYAGPV